MDPDVRAWLHEAGRVSREAKERAMEMVAEGGLLLDVAEEI